MDHKIAKKHSLDISHVSAVELPLIVKNPDKAVEMLGGKSRIRRAVNHLYRQLPVQPSSHSVDERNLELRLRKDPFHHPIQATVNRREKILIKVKIPKSSLPADYQENPGKYTIRELIERNKSLGGAEHIVEPVSIINKNYNFRAIADFQMTTKNNQFVQQFNDDVLNTTQFQKTREYYEEHLTQKDDFKNPANYENRDHQLIPPPHFSGVRFPFDYKYQKSPYTVTLRDELGDARVIMKSDTKKLFTNTVDYHKDAIPETPLPEIIAKYEWLKQHDLSEEYADKKLYDCIRHLTMLFDLKPVWLRKLLIDVVPENLKSAVKEALPYVSYCYKNGPWRFCNVKLGVNPKQDKLFWMFQSEYFRLQGMHLKDRMSEGPRITPYTIRLAQPNSDVTLSESLFFTGTKLPRAINYQIGDILDTDIVELIQKAQQKDGSAFFRDAVDPLDGWITKQVMETIRQIVRYKLRRLHREEPIDKNKVASLIAADYSEKNGEKDDDFDIEQEEEKPTFTLENDAEEDQMDLREDGEEDEEEDEDMEDATEYEASTVDPELSKNGTNEAENPVNDPISSEESLMNHIKQVDERTAAKVELLVGLIKQDSLRNLGA